MSGKRKQNFIEGALILMIANLVVKIIGAGFKIPLNWLIDDEGMGIFGKAYTIYSSLFVIATAGLPVAISKMVSESLVSDNKVLARKILRAALFILGIIGLLGTAVLYCGADWFSVKLGDPACADAIRMISPAVFFVSVLSALRGFFQGHGDMRPTALSEVVESTVKLAVGLILSAHFIKQGFKAGAEGAILGVAFGTLCALIALCVVRFLQSRKEPKSGTVSCGELSDISKKLLIIAIPITIGAAVTSLTSIIDMATISNRLIEIGFSVEKARELYGAYTGKAITLFNMPPTLIAAVSMSIVPAIAAAMHAGDKNAARENSTLAVRVTFLLTLPCAVGMMSLSDPILHLLFGENIAGDMLMCLAPAVLFVSLVSVTTAILQASGKVYLPVIHMLIGGIVKVVVNYILVGIPQININGAGIGTGVCYLLIAVLNLRAVSRICDMHLTVSDIIKPLVASLFMAFVAIGSQYAVLCFTDTRFSVLFSIALAAIVYLIVLLMSQGIRKNEILALPKGEKIASMLRRWL